MKTNKEEFEEMIGKCFAELSTARKEKYDADKAVNTASLFLEAQMLLAFFIADIELQASHFKNEIERIESIVYFRIKDETLGKKPTEATLVHFVAKDPEVIAARRASAEGQAELKKYNYLMSSLKEGHIFFRNIGKAKGPWTE